MEKCCVTMKAEMERTPKDCQQTIRGKAGGLGQSLSHSPEKETTLLTP